MILSDGCTTTYIPSRPLTFYNFFCDFSALIAVSESMVAFQNRLHTERGVDYAVRPKQAVLEA